MAKDHLPCRPGLRMSALNYSTGEGRVCLAVMAFHCSVVEQGMASSNKRFFCSSRFHNCNASKLKADFYYHFYYLYYFTIQRLLLILGQSVVQIHQRMVVFLPQRLKSLFPFSDPLFHPCILVTSRQSTLFGFSLE